MLSYVVSEIEEQMYPCSNLQLGFSFSYQFHTQQGRGDLLNKDGLL